MSNNNQLRIGVVLSYLNLALSSLIPFFYTPVMLRMLGDAEYGLYSLANSVIGYLSLLSFGFGGTIVRYITMYRAKGEKEKMEKTFGFFLALFCAIAVIVMIGGIILSLNTNLIFHKGLTEAELRKMRILMQIMAFNTAMSFPISVFTSVIMSHERYLFRKLVDMIITVAVPLSNLLMLYLGFASIGMALTNTILQFVMLPVNIIYCARNLHIRPKRGRLGKGLIKEMVGFSAYTFLATVVDMLFFATDKVILGMLTNTVVVAVYNIGATFNSMIVNLSSAMSNVLAPKVTVMVARESTEEDITDLFIRVGRLQFIIVSLAVSGFAVFGQEFVFLWVGKTYSASYYIALLTLVPLCIPLIQNTGLVVVMAQNKHKFRSITYFIIAIINVVSTYLVVPYTGAIGAALCSAISYIAGQGIIMNIYYYRVTRINIPLFWKNIGKMSIVPVLLTIVGFVLKRYIFIDNWIFFFVCVIVYTILFGILMILFTMNSYEKEIIMKPIKMIKNKL